ncbi:lysylphosphatidylglycerol synthetase-like protein (DUF2156 family) [Antricoccus suffuscus]|uniref:Lysylphosphatidylglycerol synthetase-like protein (DUF2156 family) n=1 Tax=Antricoccus suffuscus TaxID=1629062 RepID=A0A2T0ZWR4_9ACTN|nr:lysylphosphatidylglycerol synthetase-like protein (DUF2156 family) [Antricoccus suffuscus]
MPKNLARIGAFSSSIRTVIRRTPFTSTVCAITLLLGIVTGALWTDVTSFSWYADVAYGAPSFAEGHWWSIVTGAFFGLVPLFYLPIVAGFALLVGYAEYRVGTTRVAVVAITGHIFGAIGAAGLLQLLAGHGWGWADQVVLTTDVGPSAGMLAVAAAATALVRAPWRGWARLALVSYVGISFLYIGTLADVMHLIVVVPGLLVGPLLISRQSAGQPELRDEPRTMRTSAAFGMLALGAVQILATAAVFDAPLGQDGLGVVSGIEKVLVIAGAVVLANGVRRGHRLAWIGSTVTCAFMVLVGAAGFVGVSFALWPDVLGISGGSAAFAFVTMLLWAGELGLLLGLRPTTATSGDRARTTQSSTKTRELLMRYGGQNLSWMSTWRGNWHFLSADRASAVAFRRHAGVAIAVGNPIAAPHQTRAMLDEFADMCEESSVTPCLFGADGAAADWATARGWSATQVAQDALVDLPDLKFKGKRWQDVRTAMNRAHREGISFSLAPLRSQPRAIVDQVRNLSDQWVAEKELPEMGFTLGGIEEAEDPATRVALAIGPGGMVHAVVSWLPIYGSRGAVRGWTLDVMRRTNDGFALAVDFLISSSMLQFQREGAQLVSLSGAPLVGAGVGSGPLVKKVFDLLGAALEPAYGFRSLHAYKRKFQPRYEPMYLIFRDVADLPRIGIALTRAYLPDAGIADLVRLRRATSHVGPRSSVRESRPHARGTAPRATRPSGRRAPAGHAPSRQRKRALLGQR